MAKSIIELDLKFNGEESVAQVEQKTQSLRTKLRELKAELASGNLQGEAFNKMAAEAGKLQDKITDVNQRVKNLASDTSKLDGFISLTQGIVGGFAAVQGITALVGDENEDLQKTMVKLQGALAALTGIQAIANVLQKESAALTLLQSARTTALTFIQTRYNMVIGATTGLMKVLRIVGATLGIGLIVIAIASLIANFDKLKDSVGRFLPSLQTVINLFKRAWNVITDLIGITSDATRAYDKLEEATQKYIKAQEQEIELMKARGATSKEVWAAERAIIDTKLRLLQELVKMNGKLSEKELEDAEELQHQKRILDATYIKEKEEGERKAGEESAKRRKEERDRKKKEDEQAFADLFAQLDKERDLEFEANERAKERSQKESDELFSQLEKENELEFESNQRAREREIEAEKVLLQQKQDVENAKVAIVQNSVGAINALGEALIGQQFKQSAAGKVVALAQIASDTATAYIAGLRIAQQSAAATGPAAAFAFPVFYSAQVAAILGAVGKARSILGGGGASSGGGGASSGGGTAPSIRGFVPESRQQNQTTGVQRVVVLEKDITNVQDRVSRVRENAEII